MVSSYSGETTSIDVNVAFENCVTGFVCVLYRNVSFWHHFVL